MTERAFVQTLKRGIVPMIRRDLLLSSSAAALVVTLLTGAAPAFAQPAAPAVESITVTGTNIRGAVTVGSHVATAGPGGNPGLGAGLGVADPLVLPAIVQCGHRAPGRKHLQLLFAQHSQSRGFGIELHAGRGGRHAHPGRRLAMGGSRSQHHSRGRLAARGGAGRRRFVDLWLGCRRRRGELHHPQEL